MSYGDNPMMYLTEPNQFTPPVSREIRTKTRASIPEIQDLSSMTRQEIRKLQRELGVQADGIAGRQTKTALRKRTEISQTPAKEEPNFFQRLFSGNQVQTEENSHYQETTRASKGEREKIGKEETRETNIRFINENVSYRWRGVAMKSLNHLKAGEVYTKETPLLLFDTSSSRGVLIHKGSSTEFPISVSQYGTLKRNLARVGDHKTPTDWLQRFTNVYIAPTLNGDASRSRKGANRGVTGARIESREADGLGQRWVHGMPIGDSTNPATIGCIAIDNATIRPLAKTVQIALASGNKAYGYTA